MHSSPKDTVVKEKRDVQKCSVKKHHGHRSRKLSQLYIGERVFFQHVERENWKFGKVTVISGPKTNQVESLDGDRYRRNHVHMRPTKVIRNAHDKCPIVMYCTTPD